MHTHSHERMSPSTKLALAVFLGIAAFYIWTEHQAHFFQFLPYALFLLCPLMHIFMHGAHGGHEEQAEQETQDPERSGTTNKKGHQHDSGCH